MTIALAPEIEKRIQTEAVRCGVSPDTYANQALAEYFAQANPNESFQHGQLTPEEHRARHEDLVALFQQWGEEEVDESEDLDEDFFRRLQENRVRFREVVLPEE